MSELPERSIGILLSPMRDRAIAYDLVTETAHQLNASAGMLLAVCDGETAIDAAVAQWVDASGADSKAVRADVTTGLALLDELSLTGRNEPFDAPDPRVGSTAQVDDDVAVGAVHRVIDYQVAFRGPSRELLKTLDDFLGTGVRAGAETATMFFDVHEEPDGQVVLVTDTEWKLPYLEACLLHSTAVVNDYAVSSHSCAALHAGAVRSPEGEVVLLPAPSGYGKSTITGAFGAAGWDYLGDEAIGVRSTGVAVGYPKRLAMMPASREVLNLPVSDNRDLDPAELRNDVARLDGDVGPVTRVVLPRFEEGAELSIERLEPHEAVVDLLANTLNQYLESGKGRAGRPRCDLPAGRNGSG